MKKTMVALLAMLLLQYSTGLSNDDLCQVSGNSTSTQYINSTINLKILLVQFSDVKCKMLNGNIPKYSQTNFEEMLGSDGIYVSPNRYTPDGDAVYGSMNDYFRKMSSGNVVINATLLNNLDDYSKPAWITLPHTKMEYHSYTNGYDVFTDASTDLYPKK